MLVTQESLGFIPMGTKIYLKNKQLVEVQNLKFGDEILSISIFNENSGSLIDTYYKYFDNEEIKITIDQLYISSSYITDIRYQGHSDKNIVEIDNFGHIEQNQPFLVMNKFTGENIFKVKNISRLDFNNESDSEYMVSLEKDIKTDTKDFFIFNDKIKNISIVENKIPLFSMSLSNGNFYVTENMILLGTNI